MGLIFGGVPITGVPRCRATPLPTICRPYRGLSATTTRRFAALSRCTPAYNLSPLSGLISHDNTTVRRAVALHPCLQSVAPIGAYQPRQHDGSPRCRAAPLPTICRPWRGYLEAMITKFRSPAKQTQGFAGDRLILDNFHAIARSFAGEVATRRTPIAAGEFARVEFFV